MRHAECACYTWSSECAGLPVVTDKTQTTDRECVPVVAGKKDWKKRTCKSSNGSCVIPSTPSPRVPALRWEGLAGRLRADHRFYLVPGYLLT